MEMHSDTEVKETKSDTTERSVSVVTISCSAIQPLQGSSNDDNPKASVLQTLKRPSISKDVQKIIAKREKHSAKSEYDEIPNLPPLPRLTDTEASVSSKEIKREKQSDPRVLPSDVSQESLHQQKQSASFNKQESSQCNSPVTSSNIQPNFSSTIQSQNSSCFTSNEYSLQSISVHSSLATLSEKPSNINSVNNRRLEKRNLQTNATSIQSNYSSSILSTNSTGIRQGLCEQTSLAFSQVAQPTSETFSVPTDPRLCPDIRRSQNKSPKISGTQQHNYILSSAMSVNNTTAQVQPPMFSRSELHNTQSSNISSTASTSQTSSKTETIKSRSRSGSKEEDKARSNKKDCADIIVRYLTPYYKSGEVESKSQFKSLAKQMTERLIQDIGNVSTDKMKNIARSLVKTYFDTRRKKASKVK